MSSFEWNLMENLGSPPPMVEGGEIKYFEGYLWLAAGQATSSENRYPKGFFRYKLSTRTWEDISNLSNTYISRYSGESALVGGYFYLIYGWNSDLGRDLSEISRVSLNSTDFAWENFTTSKELSIDSFTATAINSEIYIFGGDSVVLDSYLNELFTINTDSGLIKTISKNSFSPSPRAFHSLYFINGEIYTFGGKDKENYLNDIWVFNLDTLYWRSINLLGSVPSARSRYSASSDGDALVLWGGKNSNGLLNDMFIFNALTGNWKQIFTNSIDTPSAAMGTCMVLQIPYVYMYGGVTDSGFSSELWMYNLGTNEFTLLSTDVELAYASCQISGNDFFVMFGSTYGDRPIGNIRKYNLITKTWKDFYSADYVDFDTSQGIQMLIGDFVFRIAGQAWGLDSHKEIFLFSQDKSTNLGTIDEYSYALGFVYYNTSIYCFGGSSVVQSLLRPDVPHNRFFQIDLVDICKENICQTLCSAGTYFAGNTCKICPAGTYAENIGNTECSLCAAGTYNNIQRATSKRQCYPCPNGTFMSEKGASRCLQCPVGFLCPIGSKSPITFSFPIVVDSIQPTMYMADSQDKNILIFQITIGTVVAFIILIIVFWEKIHEKIKLLDVYQSMHNYEMKKPLILDRTLLGGVFTLVFVLLALIVIVTTFVNYQYSNILENKSLVPLAILADEVEDFTSKTLKVFISLTAYTDICAVEQVCSPRISLETLNIRSSSWEYSCDISEIETCTVSYICKDCIIDTGALISLLFDEQLSYSTGIYINVTADSSIPNQQSSILSNIVPSENSIFVGSLASEFFFAMTPSLFHSESSKWPSQSTGYHVSSESSPIIGSESLTIELPVKSQLKIDIHLNKSIFALYTLRTLKQSLIFVLSGLVGSVFGVMGAVGGAMSFIEGKAKISKKKKEKYQKKILWTRRKELQNAFEAFKEISILTETSRYIHEDAYSKKKSAQVVPI